MLQVKFYDSIEDELLKFAVIVSKANGKWVFCKHKERDTYECPGGHREPKEAILDTARRELYEETGALEYIIKPIGIYSVCRFDEKEPEAEEESFGMLYFADIKTFGQLPDLEIERIELLDSLPNNWTYPLIQPELLKRVEAVIEKN